MTANTSSHTVANAAADTAARVWMLLPMILLWLGSAETGISSGDRVLELGSGPGSETVTTAEPWTGQAVLPVTVKIPVVEDVRAEGSSAARRNRNVAHAAGSQDSPFMATAAHTDNPAVRRHLLQVYRC